VGEEKVPEERGGFDVLLRVQDPLHNLDFRAKEHYCHVDYSKEILATFWPFSAIGEPDATVNKCLTTI
jgi:hypothetical protein